MIFDSVLETISLFIFPAKAAIREEKTVLDVIEIVRSVLTSASR